LCTGFRDGKKTEWEEKREKGRKGAEKKEKKVTRERERERERSLFAISLITSHITKSINGRLLERKNSIIAGHL